MFYKDCVFILGIVSMTNNLTQCNLKVLWVDQLDQIRSKIYGSGFGQNLRLGRLTLVESLKRPNGISPKPVTINDLFLGPLSTTF